MGEIKYEDIASVLYTSRVYLQNMLKYSKINAMSFVILCMVTAQYMAALYADLSRINIKDKEGSYEAYPTKLSIFLSGEYKPTAEVIASYRNIFCHEIGSKKYFKIIQGYEKALPDILKFIDAIVLNDRILESDTRAKVREFERK